MVLFSGDGAFRAMVRSRPAARRAGDRRLDDVDGAAIMLADELRRQADDFIDLAELRVKLGRGAALEKAIAVVRSTRVCFQERE